MTDAAAATTSVVAVTAIAATPAATVGDFPFPYVIDAGSANVLAGFASEELPRILRPSVVLNLRTNMMMSYGMVKEWQSGDEALERSSRMIGAYRPTWFWPLEPPELAPPGAAAVPAHAPGGAVAVGALNWNVIEKLINDVYYQDLRDAPEEHPLLWADRQWFSRDHRERLIQHAFETMNVPAFCLVDSALLSSVAHHGTQQHDDTCLYVDMGHSGVVATPLYHRTPVSHAVRKTTLGGEAADRYFVQLLRSNEAHVAQLDRVRTQGTYRYRLRAAKEDYAHSVLDPSSVLSSMKLASVRHQQRADRLAAMRSMATKSGAKFMDEKTDIERANEKLLDEWIREDEEAIAIQTARSNGTTSGTGNETKEMKDGKSNDATTLSSSSSTSSTASVPNERVDAPNNEWLGLGDRRPLLSKRVQDRTTNLAHIAFDDITIGTEGWNCSEVMWQPSLLTSMATQRSVQATIVDAIMACDEALRPLFVKNIRLFGGLTRQPGIHARLTATVRSELQQRGVDASLIAQLFIHPITSPLAHIKSLHKPRATLPNPADISWNDLDSTGPRIPDLTDVASGAWPCDISVWRGGSILACDAAWVPNWIHKTEYDEVGPNVVIRKCIVT